MTGTSNNQVVLVRKTLSRYPNREAFKTRYAAHMSRGGMLLQTKPYKKGTVVQFVLTVADGETVLRGEGIVQGIKKNSKGKFIGIVLKFTKLDRSSKKLAREMVGEKVRRVSGNFKSISSHSKMPNIAPRSDEDLRATGERKTVPSNSSMGVSEHKNASQENKITQDVPVNIPFVQEPVVQEPVIQEPVVQNVPIKSERVTHEDSKVGSSRVRRSRRRSRLNEKKLDDSEIRFQRKKLDSESSLSKLRSSISSNSSLGSSLDRSLGSSKSSEHAIPSLNIAKKSKKTGSLPKGTPNLVSKTAEPIDDISAVAFALEDSFDSIFSGGLFGSGNDSSGGMFNSNTPSEDSNKVDSKEDEDLFLEDELAETPVPKPQQEKVLEDEQTEDEDLFLEDELDKTPVPKPQQEKVLEDEPTEDEDLFVFDERETKDTSENLSVRDTKEGDLFADSTQDEPTEDENLFVFDERGTKDTSENLSVRNTKEGDLFVEHSSKPIRPPKPSNTQIEDDDDDDDEVFNLDDIIEADDLIEEDDEEDLIFSNYNDTPLSTTPVPQNKQKEESTARRIHSLIESITGEHQTVDDSDGQVRDILATMSGPPKPARPEPVDALDNLLGNLNTQQETMSSTMNIPDNMKPKKPKKKKGFFSRFFGSD